MKIKQTVIFTITCLFICMWIYAAVAKWGKFDVFVVQMNKQPLPAFMAPLLIWALPPFEIAIALLLFIDKTRRLGLWLSAILMTSFSIYVALLTADLLGKVPCACAGIFQKMSWENHLLFNIGFTALAFIALWLSYKTNRDAPPPAGRLNARLATSR
jgi:hypothetical protein